MSFIVQRQTFLVLDHLRVNNKKAKYTKYDATYLFDPKIFIIVTCKRMKIKQTILL